VNPFVGLGLAQVELKPMCRLERIRFLIDQNEEQLIFGCCEARLVSAARFPTSGCACPGVRQRMQLGGFLQEGRNQSVKLGYGQARHAEKLARFLFQSSISYHARSIHYFR
jgi:hypothetical protein